MLWRIKLLAKLILSRLPLRYQNWRSLGLFRHGDMSNPKYALSIFDKHFKQFLINGGQAKDSTFLELGPGDTLFSAIIAHTYDVKETILLDAGAFATRSVSPYVLLFKHLKEIGLKCSDFSQYQNIDAILEECGGVYMTEGLSSLRKIADHSVDFVFSQAVLEHIMLDEFDDYLIELSRILKPHGIMSHRIDFKDHLGGGLNNLRFQSRIWESSWFAKRSGFYTNRLRCSQILSSLQNAGFLSTIIKADRWPKQPIDKKSLPTEFIGKFSEDDLCIHGIDIVSRLKR